MIDRLPESIDLSKQKIVILGQGILVGRPLTKMLQERGFDVIPMDEFTYDSTKVAEADLIVSAVGQPKFLKKEMIKEGTILIDCGCTLIKNKDGTKRKEEEIVQEI